MTSEDVDRILFGVGQPVVPGRIPPVRTLNQRFTQETPILPEVWYEFARDTSRRVDLLITPLNTKPANSLLQDLAKGRDGTLPVEARPMALRNFVAVALTFDELIDLVLPRTSWGCKAADRFRNHLPPFVAGDPRIKRSVEFNENPYEIFRILSLIGAIMAARGDVPQNSINPDLTNQDALHWLLSMNAMGRIEDRSPPNSKPTIWRVALNRSLDLADEQARSTIKADAAYRLFDVRCDTITWAVIDSGIDVTHPAFTDPDGTCRVTEAFDFACLRDLLNFAYAGRERDNPQLAASCASAGLSVAQGARLLARAHKGTTETDSVNWGAIEPLIKFKEKKRPTDSIDRPLPADHHGTHVAGIIGANWREDDKTPIVVGVCQDIRLMDLRILADDLEQTEYAVIAALQFVGYRNTRNNRIAVHGVNLSLSIPHAVKNYACGHTPVCDECEALIGGGTVVVAAAGNYGYAGSLVGQSATDGYVTARITDPGNAQSVITVGATHRREPHTYGISYFSSRGPTGDGRIKPDLVAPGEGIRSTLPGGEYGAARRHQPGGAARQWRGGAVDGALSRTDRSACADQAIAVRQRDRPGARADLSGARPARHPARAAILLKVAFR